MDNEKFQGKYRIESCRLKEWDYSNYGYYFITVCVKDQVHYFGEVESEKMHLSRFGKIAVNYWVDMPNHFPFVKLDEFIVMPNHIHGIIIIDNKGINDIAIKMQNFFKRDMNTVVETQDVVKSCRDEAMPRLLCNIPPYKHKIQGQTLMDLFNQNVIRSGRDEVMLCGENINVAKTMRDEALPRLWRFTLDGEWYGVKNSP